MSRAWGFRVALMLAACGPAASAWAETIELVTYYPSSATTGDLHVTSLTVGTAYNGVTPPDGVAAIYDKLWIGQGYTNPDLDPAALRVVGFPGVADKVLFLPGTGGGTLNVGIGTASPLSPLDVSSTTSSSSGTATAIFQDTNGFLEKQLYFAVGSRATGLWPLTTDTATTTIGASGTTAMNLAFASGNTEMMRITSAGNVGIGTAAPNSRLDVEGSMSLGVTVVTASLALTDAHNVILTNGAGNITITLPAATNRTGRTYYIKKTDAGAGTVTINAAGGALVEGAAAFGLYAQGDMVRVITDGFNWFTISGANELHPHMAKMARAAVQNIPSETATKIAFDTEEFDVGNIASTATDRFTILRAGRYSVTASWWQSSTHSQWTLVGINRNGSSVANSVSWDDNRLENDSDTITEVLDLAAGDYLEMVVVVGLGGTQPTDTGIPSRPRMSVVELRS